MKECIMTERIDCPKETISVQKDCFKCKIPENSKNGKEEVTNEDQNK
jgi:hypothetical protein